MQKAIKNIADWIENGFKLQSYASFPPFSAEINIRRLKMDFPFDVSGIVINTDRLTIRPFAETDLNDFNAYASVPGVGECAGWPHHKSLEESKKILTTFLENKSNFALFHKEDDKVIGSLGLHAGWTSRNEKYKHLKAKEIGYVIAKDYWGIGLAAEAVKAIVNYGFEHLGVEAFGIAHFAENAASRRVAEKCGFMYVETG